MSDESFPSFPVAQARTARFTLGRPRGFVVAPDGSRIAFLRSRGGTDRVTRLWVYDLASASETLVADPSALSRSEPTGETLTAAERARRERARERASGIVTYSTDAAVSKAAFALAGRLYVADLPTATVRAVEVGSAVFDPRLDPTGRRVAYTSAGTLRVTDIDTQRDGPDDRTDDVRDVELAGEAGISWGVAEFVAAEEMGRQRGFWWAPDGSALLAARVDESAVLRWHIGDPAAPDKEPVAIAYPAAGTTNADVSLWLMPLDGTRREIRWDRDEFPYLATVRWPSSAAPLLRVFSRDQRRARILDVDTATGDTVLVHEDRDAHWVDAVAGVPDRLADGRLVHAADDGDTRRLFIAGAPVSPPGLQVRSVLAVSGGDVLFSATSEPTEQHVWAFFDGPEENEACERLTLEPGVHVGTGASDVLVVVSADLAHDGARVVVRKNGVDVAQIASFEQPPPLVPNVSISRQGERELRTALVLPRDHVPGTRLPVLMNPYAGPHAQRVLASRANYLESQWLADQGFAVVIIDGRGTPARGTSWEREIAGDLATPVLDDQVAALFALAQENPDLDLTRVGIRGWSFGGYLAALAVLRRPDVFHAAVAGAPVTDWRLYDTYYTERYLGVDTSSPAYDLSSLIDDAPKLARPLLLVHGLADDNVVAAHSLRLSTALLAAGRPHQVLPLSGVTHMASGETVAANLIGLEVSFLRSALGIS